jgi:hypothetical protein
MPAGLSFVPGRAWAEAVSPTSQLGNPDAIFFAEAPADRLRTQHVIAHMGLDEASPPREQRPVYDGAASASVSAVGRVAAASNDRVASPKIRCFALTAPRDISYLHP